VSDVVKVDRAALAAAASTIAAHADLIRAAIVDIYADDGGGPANGNMREHAAQVIRDIGCALSHIVIEDFRSDEARGGS
jgi:hypothetical protein